MKKNRHKKILKLISEMPVQTQEQLTELLKQDGYSVTQATVSRDIKELGLIKISSQDGYIYSQGKPTQDHGHNINVFSRSVISIDSALHTIVIKTYSGMAPGVAASVDAMLSNDILGSIAGDDTILLITKSEDSAQKLIPVLEKLFV